MNDVKSNVYAVILAGGSGTRFWPLSRELSPKQILTLFGPDSLLKNTMDRLESFIPIDRIFIVTSSTQAEILKPHLPNLPEENIIIEPIPRNTAPCIGLAAFHIQGIDPNGTMVVLPSDHKISDVEAFIDVLKAGVEFVEKENSLVTIGIPPSRPETGYGYIQFNDFKEDEDIKIHNVKTFAEKPNKPTAERFVQAGDFYWNSGIFIWKAKTILKEMDEHLPEPYEQLRRINQAFGCKDYQEYLANHYNRIKPISIDYGIMEVTNSTVYMLRGDFGWSDVGSWDELYRIRNKDSDGNVSEGDTVLIDSSNNMVHSPDKLTAIVGLDNILIVNTGDATLICPLDRAQDVKAIAEKLKKDGRKEYL